MTRTIETSPATMEALCCAFTHWFAVPPLTARVLVLLYQKPDKATFDEIGSMMTKATRNGISQHIGMLRQALDDGAIEHVAGSGYRLTESGRHECRNVLQVVSSELVGAI